MLQDDVDSLYELWKEGRKGPTSIEDSVNASIQQLEDYIEKCGGTLITATKNNTNDTKGSNQKTKMRRKSTV